MIAHGLSFSAFPRTKTNSICRKSDFFYFFCFVVRSHKFCPRGSPEYDVMGWLSLPPSHNYMRHSVSKGNLYTFFNCSKALLHVNGKKGTKGLPEEAQTILRLISLTK